MASSPLSLHIICLRVWNILESLFCCIALSPWSKPYFCLYPQFRGGLYQLLQLEQQSKDSQCLCNVYDGALKSSTEQQAALAATYPLLHSMDLSFQSHQNHATLLVRRLHKAFSPVSDQFSVRMGSEVFKFRSPRYPSDNLK